MATGNTVSGNADAGVYVFGRANSASGNVIQKNVFSRNVYGILLYNAPNNGQYFTLRQKNRFARNSIAEVREFSGAVPSTSKSSGAVSTSARKHSHRDLRPQPRRHQ